MIISDSNNPNIPIDSASIEDVSIENVSIDSLPVKILFVCLGNICRSPTAHAIFEQKVSAQGLDQFFMVDSAATGAWHVGCAPDRRTSKVAAKHGYPMDHLRARQVCASDFNQFDYILAMDKNNLRELEALSSSLEQEGAGQCRATLALFLPFSGCSSIDEVPDPYAGEDADFEQVLSIVEQAVQQLVEVMKRNHLSSS